MGRHESSRSKREISSSKSSRRHRNDGDTAIESESEPTTASPSASDSSESRDVTPRRRRSRSKNRSRRLHLRDSDDQSSDDDDYRQKKSKKRRKITEEDIAEYMTKKAQKKAAKVAKKLNSPMVSGYANDSNPFGDSNLNEKFVWRKKIECDISHGVPLDAFSLKAEKKRQRERMALLAREQARAEFQDWERKEEEFHFEQSMVWSEIRLREGRVKPIDILTKHLDPSDDLDIEINEPYMVFKGLSVKEMEELQEDIKMHLDMDRATPTHIQYWEALLVVCSWELAEARKKDALDRARVRGKQLPPELLAEERGMHSSIEAEVKKHLQEKTYYQLEALQSQIESQMQSGTAKVVEYWEALLKRLPIFMAKASLKEIHAKMLRKHLQRLQKPLEVEDTEKEWSPEPDIDDSDHDRKDARDFSPEPIFQEETEEADEDAGSYSPELFNGDENEEAIDPNEDKAILVTLSSSWLSNPEDIGTEGAWFFKDLYTEEPNVEAYLEILAFIPQLIKEADNIAMGILPSQQEVKDAIFALDKDCASSPDGFTRSFFRSC